MGDIAGLAAGRPWRARKMRFALHLGVASPEKPLFRELVGTLDPLDHIRFAAALGFSAVTDNGLKLRPASEQSAMGEALAQHGMSMGSFTNSPMGTPNIFWGDPDPHMEAMFLRCVDESIEAGRRAGGREITTVAMRATGIDIDVQIKTFGERVRRAADRAAAAGMTLSIEPTSATRTPQLLIHHIADARRILGPSTHSGLRLMFDTGHVHEMDGDPVVAFRANAALIETVQLADAAARVEPGAGRTDFAAFFAALRDDGFAGLFELECYMSEPGEAGERAALARLAAIIEAV